MSETRLNRRQFLTRSTVATLAAVAPQVVPSRLLGATAPSKQITVGFVGMGRQGTGRNLSGFLACPDVRVLAVCDCKLSQTGPAKAKVDEAFGNSDCDVYQDFRDVLGRRDIDVVVISTPDHWHVPMSLMALRAGKDVFCEKPTLTITEGRELVDVAAKLGKVFQWGIEDRSLIKYWMLAGLARTGAIGTVHKVTCALPLKPVFDLEEPAPIPDDLDWNLWLGPAPFADYTPTVLDPQRWRQRADYSGGSLTDWGAHLCDTAQVGIGMDASGPVEISGTARDLPATSYVTAPFGYDIQYRYANDAVIHVENKGVHIRFEGSEGWIQCEGWNGKLTASDMNILRRKDFAEHPDFWERPVIEHRNFVDAVISRGRPTYHPEAGHRLATMLHLGQIAVRAGKAIHWSPEQEQFTRDGTEHQASSVYRREARDWAKES